MLETALKKKSKLASINWKNALAFFAYYGSLLSLSMAGVQLANGEEISKGILGPSLLALLLAVGGAFFLEPTFRKILSGTWGLVYWSALAIYTASGIGQGNDSLWLRMDILTFLWLLGGLALFRLMLKAGNPSWHLLALMCIATFILYYSQAVVLLDANIETVIRVLSKNNVMFFYAELLLVPTGIAIGILARKGIFWSVVVFALVGLQFFCVTILSATRASTFSLLVVLITSSVGLSYQLYKGTLALKKSLYARAISLLVICLAAIVLIALFGGGLSEYSLISERIQEDSGTGDMRVEELVDALSQLSRLQFFLGGGLGLAFDSTLDYQINALHIGIFTFLLKFGLLIFALLVSFLYLRLPYLYVTAWLRPLSVAPNTRSAILTVLPGIFGWLVILSLSGGYSQYSFLGVGFGLGAFLHIQECGLVKFLPSTNK